MRQYGSSKMMQSAVPILLVTSLAWTALGQATSNLFEKAPPGVEEALRDRVGAFYKTWSEGKFRAGEKYVAEDAQETYYNMQKQKLDNCEIIALKFEREFNDAVVTIACKGKWNFQGQVLDQTLAHTDFWSMEKDAWVWTVKPVKSVASPFGEFNYANIDESKGLFNPETGMPKDFNALGHSILKQVAIDKTEVMLSSFEKKSAVVTLKNGINGSINVRADADGGPLGFKATFDEPNVPGNGEAKLTLSYDPKDDVSAKPAATVRIYVEPINKMFTVKVTFAIPDEVQKLIDKSKTGK